jgi:RNA methyltransferase, TrmH family
MISKATVKDIQSLTHKKFRDEYGLFIAEGPKVIEELLSSNEISCKTICALPDWLKENEKILNTKSIADIIEVVEMELEKISQLSTPNKVLGVFHKKNLKENKLAGKITLVLDDIQDPGNMGTIIRIADWFGLENIICSENSVDIYNSKVVQSSMGSIARVNVLYKDLAGFLQLNNSITTMAAALEGKEINSLGKIKEAILIIGNESKGIHPSLLKMANQKITIPRYGNAESLNAAVAAGIILSHIS